MYLLAIIGTLMLIEGASGDVLIFLILGFQDGVGGGFLMTIFYRPSRNR